MSLFLTVFSLFNLAAAAGGAGAGVRLVAPGAARAWRSRRLLAIARVMTGGLAVIALAATAAAWTLAAGAPGYAVLVLAPIGWLVLMGCVFALVDLGEDGVLDLGRGVRRD